MVTYCVTEMITTCSSMIEQFVDTMTVASSDKECLNDPSKSKRWKLFLATLKVFVPSKQSMYKASVVRKKTKTKNTHLTDTLAWF